MKKKLLVPSILFALAAVIAASCGKKEEKANLPETASYLPESIERIGLKRSDEIRAFRSDDLWEYIDGGAEIYLQYGFRDLVTTEYKDDDVDLVVDLYRFATPLQAYGLYTMLRPEHAELVNLGMEGFTSPANLNFVKGPQLVRVIGYDESTQSNLAIINLAEELAKTIPGTSSKPGEFAYLPDSNGISGTDDYYSDLFLGQKYLTDVFSQGYLLKGDTVTLFMMPDSTGGKFAEWRRYSEKIEKQLSLPEDIPFDSGYGMRIDDSFYGDIVAGLKKGYLVGMVGFSQKQKEYFIDWLNKFESEIMK